MAATDGFLSRSVALIRNFALDSYEEVQWTDASLADLLNTANAQVYEEMVSVSDPKVHYQRAEFDVDLVSGTDEYVYPANMRKLIRLYKENTDGDYQKEILLAAPNSNLPGMVMMGTDRGFKIVPVPQSNSNDWILEYIPGVTPFLWQGLQKVEGGGYPTPTTTSFGVDTTFAYGSFIDQTDYYVNSYIRFISGTEKESVRRITGQVLRSHSTTKAQLTITPALTNAPVAGDIIEVLPCLKPPFDKAIAWRVVMTMKAADADQRHYLTAKTEYDSLMRTVMNREADLQARVGPSITEDWLDGEDYGYTLI